MADVIIKCGNNAMGTNGGALKLSNLSPENIKKDVNIGGIIGTFEGEVYNYMYKSITMSSNNQIMTITEIPFTPVRVVICKRDGDTTGTVRLVDSLLSPVNHDSWCVYSNSSGYLTTVYTLSSWSFSFNNGTLTINTNDSNIKFGTGKAYDVTVIGE